jgi:phosphate:Na+ symporter
MPLFGTVAWPSLLLGLIGGLALFLFGLSLLSDALKEVAGERVKSFLAQLTTNRFAAVATGAGATVVLDSSSATTILVISLVNAGLLPLQRSLAVILGANIGTTFSSLIVAMDVTEYAPLALLAGFLLRTLTRQKRLQQYGTVLLALGLVFFGLKVMGDAMRPLRDHQPFLDFIEHLESPLYGILVGAGFTALIQSSSAMMGIVITLAAQSVIPLAVGFGLMMGAEIGTCADTLVASIGRSRAALRAGVFQLLFNVANVLLWLPFTEPLAQIAAWFAGDVPRQLAYAHVLFNFSGVAAAVGFLGPIARALERVIPDRTPESSPDYGAGKPEFQR